MNNRFTTHLIALGGERHGRRRRPRAPCVLRGIVQARTAPLDRWTTGE